MKPKKDPAKYPCFNINLKNLKGEQWREIPHTEGYYHVSNYGRVKALARIIERNGYLRHLKQRILRQTITVNRNHYRGDYKFGTMVRFRYENHKQAVMVRRLVYSAFVEPLADEKLEGMLIYPMDGDGLNSHVSNLGIATRAHLRIMDLDKDRYIPPAYLLNPEKNRKHLLQLNKQKRIGVKRYSLEGVLLGEYISLTAASRKTGVSVSAICSSAQGKTRHPGKFVWRYKSEDYNGNLPKIKTGKRPVVQYNSMGKKIAVYPSINEAVRRTGVANASICRCLKQKSRHAGGYQWRYLNGK